MKADRLGVIRHQRLVKIAEHLALALFPVLIQGQVIGTQNHILRRHGYRTSIGGLEQVAGRQHQEPGLGLGLSGQRHVNSHLVAVKVGVISGTG